MHVQTVQSRALRVLRLGRPAGPASRWGLSWQGSASRGGYTVRVTVMLPVTRISDSSLEWFQPERSGNAKIQQRSCPSRWSAAFWMRLRHQSPARVDLSISKTPSAESLTRSTELLGGGGPRIPLTGTTFMSGHRHRPLCGPLPVIV